MILGGLQKTTLIDYPDHLACTVFTVGCNFRCPFCHNKDLVTQKNFKQKKLPRIPVKDFFAFLKKRQGLLDGVCITGGEPTVHQDLDQFCAEIKQLGFKVKLDSNGSSPEVLQKLIDQKLVDFIAMDLKNSFDQYHNAIGLKIDTDRIKQSIKIILDSKLDYEFRTTVVPSIHQQENLEKLASQINKLVDNPKEFKWVLQNFRAENCLDDGFKKKKPFSAKKMKAFLKTVQEFLPATELRKDY
jgi:pyruvate formate lyase activating enzyme